jgi:hypothetical protein
MILIIIDCLQALEHSHQLMAVASLQIDSHRQNPAAQHHHCVRQSSVHGQIQGSMRQRAHVGVWETQTDHEDKGADAIGL